VLGFVKVFRRVLVLGGIAAADVTAGETKAEMYPSVAHFRTLFTHALVGIANFDLVEVGAFLWHVFLQVLS
jgi:hypothetical protein